MGDSSVSLQVGHSPQENVRLEEPRPRKPGSKAPGRKRAKTGCLTCRKRRIKCGEEKPTCLNCHKSRRSCEGYNPRVVFKSPLNSLRGSMIPTPFQTTSLAPQPDHGPTTQGQQASKLPPLPLAPRPGQSWPSSSTSDVTTSDTGLSVSNMDMERRQSSFLATHRLSPKFGITGTEPQRADINRDVVHHTHAPEPRRKFSLPKQQSHHDFDAVVSQQVRKTLPPSSAKNPSLIPKGAFPSSSQGLLSEPNDQSPTPAPLLQSNPIPSTRHQPAAVAVSVGSSYRESSSVSVILSPSAEIHAKFSENHVLNSDDHIRPTSPKQSKAWSAEDEACVPSRKFQTTEDEEDTYDIPEEDISVEDDGPGEDWEGHFQGKLQHNDFGLAVALQARQESLNLGLRSITSFIDRPNMLANYKPLSTSSPLNDPMTATIFCHFIHVTGPTISMFERHPANPSLIFQGQAVPKSQQHIWTYVFPTLALQSQGLLHAMLALASLHIAKLQNGPITASLKHYACGIRRVAKYVKSPTRRGQLDTLAASMLLAYYECWCADHQKWSNHILGTKVLMGEIEFRGMAEQIKGIKARRRQEELENRLQAGHQAIGGYYEYQTLHQTSVEDVDESIVDILMGKKVQYDEHGRIMADELLDKGRGKTYTQRELETYETQRDLFWWYCKQDVYQSILGGGKLFMEYHRWSQCPPRAPIGRLSSIYGTFDHLILLMGRLADFASKDLKRKRLAMNAAGGWRPPGAASTSGQHSSFSQTGQQSQATPVPSFSGMIPDILPPKLPMGFEQNSEYQSPENDDIDNTSLDARLIEAEEEWQEIRNAFNILEDHFGEDFQALGPEFTSPIETPFGMALQYRTYGIAGIWMNFYMALIVCYRAHPSMPPAAMMAAGIAARQTATFANELARIAAGIIPDCSKTSQVSPGIGAALNEASTCLFVSGVQYQRAEERAWLINRLRDTARLTGWQTALAIATGCETSWVKTGELGRGPVYTRTTQERVVPVIWSHSRKVDRAYAEGQSNEMRLVVQKTDRVHYALGMLGIDEDFENLALDNDEKDR